MFTRRSIQEKKKKSTLSSLFLFWFHNFLKLPKLKNLTTACNLSYSGGRDQEEHGLKPAKANSSRNLLLKIRITKKKKKKAGKVIQGEGPEKIKQNKQKYLTTFDSSTFIPSLILCLIIVAKSVDSIPRCLSNLTFPSYFQLVALIFLPCFFFFSPS
jgi:hypothetical protein